MLDPDISSLLQLHLLLFIPLYPVLKCLFCFSYFWYYFWVFFIPWILILVCLSATFIYCLSPFSPLLSLSPHLSQSQGKAILPLAPDPSGRTEAPRQCRASSSAVSFRTVPSHVPVALSPKGNSHQRQWAAYQGKQQPPPCQPATKAQTAKGEEEVQI